MLYTAITLLGTPDKPHRVRHSGWASSSPFMKLCGAFLARGLRFTKRAEQVGFING